MKKLVLTGLGNEINFKNGQTVVYTAVFNDGELRIEISSKAAEELTQAIYGAGVSAVEVVEPDLDETSEDQEATGEEFGGDYQASSDDDNSVLVDEDTGVEQV